MNFRSLSFVKVQTNTLQCSHEQDDPLGHPRNTATPSACQSKGLGQVGSSSASWPMGACWWELWWFEVGGASKLT